MAQNLKNGTAGAKAVYPFFYGSYIVMNDGTVKVVSSMDLDAVPGNEMISGSGPVSSRYSGYAVSLGITDADILMVPTAADASVPLYAFSSKPDGIAVTYSGGDAFFTEKNKIAQVSRDIILYTNHSTDVRPYLKTQLDQDITASWTDIVQLGSSRCWVIGLKKDGSLAIAKNTSEMDAPPIPVQYQSSVVRLFDDFLQQSDGTLYDLSGQKNLGIFPLMDQIVEIESLRGDPVYVGIDTTGKVHCISHPAANLPADSVAAWACTLTNVKTVWNN